MQEEPIMIALTKYLREETARRLETMKELQGLISAGGLRDEAGVEEELEELISKKYLPYLLGNAALYISFRCQRCGGCCRDNANIALSIDDCRRIAKGMGLSLKKFMIEYTAPHALSASEVEGARMIKKPAQGFCPFYDRAIPGCKIHNVKPQVCSAAYYLSKMNLLLCEDGKRFNSFPQCPADLELRKRISEFREELRKDEDAKSMIERFFLPSSPQGRLFLLLLRIKGLEIYFGREAVAPLASKLGLSRLPSDAEVRPIVFLYACILPDASGFEVD
jgi:Fe-S-cluster containining protein